MLLDKIYNILIHTTDKYIWLESACFKMFLLTLIFGSESHEVRKTLAKSYMPHNSDLINLKHSSSDGASGNPVINSTVHDFEFQSITGS